MSFYEEWKQTVTAKEPQQEASDLGKTAAELFQEKSNSYKNQFILSKKEAEPPVNKYISSEDFITTNSFNNMMTKKSAQVLTETQQVNPIIDSLDPETFEVAAKKHSSMWNTKQYKDQEFREDLMDTMNRISQGQL